ncbi:hypothetical protein BG015_007049 [Linnemannia schmuckeri]|uniref:BLOC-1-related complex subunit 5 n=1 Tax=Linnemannia schmuckeri TaxID=64567 RepID=A0A9P5VER7_9FUNG|nr:hypothetical protein BG015_007049 [Linnemannia schmuckeri]
MEQDPGIIRVVDPNEEQEDEALVALRALPKFEPLVVPDAPSHFSLTSVFGFSASADSRGASTELAFNPSVLVDILVQINAHSKRCGQDIQEFQRSLGTKMRALDDFTSGAVQELTAIHQQAKTHSGELLSVHALSKQAQTTTTLLHGIVDKLNLISDALPEEAGAVGISESAYPHLYQYIHQAPGQYHHYGYTSTGTTKSSIEYSSESRPAPSGLALLGQNTTPLNRRATAPTAAISATGAGATTTATSQGYPHHHPSSRTTALAVPKARASMALASSSLNFLPMQSTSISDLDSTFGSLTMDGSSGGGLLSGSPIPRPLSADIVQDSSQGQRHWDATGRRMNEGNGVMSPPQQRTMRASDNLRRLANKPAPGS